MTLSEKRKQHAASADASATACLSFEARATPRTVAASATGAGQRVGSPHSASYGTRFARGIRYRACRGGRDGTVGGSAITPDLVSVNALEDFNLAVVFSDGKRGVFDRGPYMNFEFMEELRDPVKFAAAYVDRGTVAWAGGPLPR